LSADVEGGSGGRTLALSALSDAQRAELAKALGPGGPTLARSPDRFLARERLAIGIAPFGLVALAALALAGFADACGPVQSAVWVVGYATALVPLAYAVVRLVEGALSARSMPFPPGVYVTGADVVIAHGPVVRVVPLAALAGVGSPRRAPLSRMAELTLWIEGEPAEALAVPAAEADAIAAALEQAREAAPTDPSSRAERRRDPLAELKRSRAFEQAPTAPPGRAPVRSLVLAIPTAIVLGALVWTARNVGSDGAALATATATNDVEALRCYVEAGYRRDAVRRVTLPHAAYVEAQASGDLERLGAYVEAYPDAPDTAQARADWIAGSFAVARDDAWRLRAFLARFPDAPQAAEGRARLPRLALEAAIAADDVGSYAYVMREHPGTPEADDAARRRSARYAATLATIVSRGGRPEAVAFFRALFAYLEGHETHDVLVRFRTPSNDELRAFDRVASELAGRPVEPIAPSFSRRLSEQREALVFDRLRAAFASVAPSDVLPVVRGRQLPPRVTDAEREAALAAVPEEERAARAEEIAQQEDDDSGEPELRIGYDVLPDGRIFTSEAPEEPRYAGDPALRAALARLGLDPDAVDPGGGLVGAREDDRAFVGFRVRFVLEMRVPDAPERARIELEVAPPPSFTVERGLEPTSDRTIYEAMVSEAFDRLGGELERALFGATPSP
jgi:hypothetical protein